MIVFCTTCKGRTQHLEQTLPKNLQDNERYPDCKFVILNYNSQDHLLDYLNSNHKASIDSGRVVVYSFHGPEVFHMAHAKNVAHRLGILEGATVLVNLDADNYTGPDFAEYIASRFRAEEDIFLWARMIQHGENRTPRGISGRIAVSVKAFLNVGGYDEKYDTWGPDDKDFNFRLRRLGYAAREMDRCFLEAVRHNDKMRFREFPHARDTSYEFDGVSASTNTIVNFGKFGKGVVFRNSDCTPMELGDVPTRIFGIGMHKTATTSLHAALKILGFDSAHWESAHWAKAIWEEMNEHGRSLTLEKSYAVSDLPITIMYRQLDAAYPGSKFILTVRNEGAWLESVRNHWSHEHNRFREAWSKDPFTHRIHKEIYGQKGFDADLFLARYRKHNADVREYFKGRPGDLLVMDVDRKSGWPALCGFLKRSIPAVPYPRQFVTPSYENGGGI